MTPDEIEQLFTRSEGIVLPDDAGDDDAGDDGQREPVLTEEEKQYRVAHLRAVLLEAHNAWVSGSEVLDRIAEKLGDGSRHRELDLRLLLSLSLALSHSDSVRLKTYPAKVRPR